jgi:hypothetical protein
MLPSLPVVVLYPEYGIHCTISSAKKYFYSMNSGLSSAFKAESNLLYCEYFVNINNRGGVGFLSETIFFRDVLNSFGTSGCSHPSRFGGSSA